MLVTTPANLAKKATIIVQPFGEEFIVRTHYTGKDDRVDVSIEWNLYKTEADALNAAKVWAGQVNDQLKVPVEIHKAVRVSVLPKPEKEPAPRWPRQRDAAGNYVCAGCGLATALTMVAGVYLCDLCAEKEPRR